MHPRIYSEAASPFSRLRGGPGVGVALSFVAAFTNLEILRQRYRRMTTDNLLLGLCLAFIATGAGVISADMWRSWKEK